MKMKTICGLTGAVKNSYWHLMFEKSWVKIFFSFKYSIFSYTIYQFLLYVDYHFNIDTLKQFQNKILLKDIQVLGVFLLQLYDSVQMPI